MRGIIRLLIVAALLAAIPLVTRSGVADPPSLPRNLGSRLRAHIDTLAKAGGTGSRVVFTDGNRWAVEYVLAEMRKSTPNVRADTFMVARKSRKTPSSLVDPVAIIAGKSDSIIVICAHIDASGSRDGGWDGNWSRAHAPGADDDGTGIAALLETLTLVAHSDLKPQYTLMFVACNAEERLRRACPCRWASSRQPVHGRETEPRSEAGARGDIDGHGGMESGGGLYADLHDAPLTMAGRRSSGAAQLPRARSQPCHHRRPMPQQRQ
jgi:hypothetical protein